MRRLENKISRSCGSQAPGRAVVNAPLRMVKMIKPDLNLVTAIQAPGGPYRKVHRDRKGTVIGEKNQVATTVESNVRDFHTGRGLRSDDVWDELELDLR